MPEIIVIEGDNLETLKGYPDNHFDSIVTDAPYGLGKEPDAATVLKDWIEHGYHEIKNSGGFMGKKWDSFVPQPLFWKEVFRVLKHGGHVVCFFGTRTYDWGVMAMRLAGFKIKDKLDWHYGSGFPKSQSVSKSIDKMNNTLIEGKETKNSRGANNSGDSGHYNHSKVIREHVPSHDEAKKWQGYGTHLKPASEPIVLAYKPMDKGLNIAENTIKWGAGVINIDGCRIETDDTVKNHSRSSESAVSKGRYGDSKKQETHQTEGQKLGRFPANVILTHHPECDVLGIGKDSGKKIYECHDKCPIKIMDNQSGNAGAAAPVASGMSGDSRGIYGDFAQKGDDGESFRDDEGGASRFFLNTEFDEQERFLYTAKASGFERNYGLINSNTHPTIKPVAVMRWLVKLVTPKGGNVLDPFGGSGTTGIACKLEDFDCVLIDNDSESCEIARQRIKTWNPNIKRNYPVINDDPEWQKQLNLFS